MDIYDYVLKQLKSPHRPSFVAIAEGSGVPDATVRWIANELCDPRISNVRRLAAYFRSLPRRRK